MFERPSTSFIRKSQENQYLNSDDQTDIFVYDTRFGVNVDLDVLLACPFSKDTINQTAKKIDLQLPKERRRRSKKKRNTCIQAKSILAFIMQHLFHWLLIIVVVGEKRQSHTWTT